MIACPCCGLPTLSEPASHEICPVCWWQDDGQDDSTAEEVRGGPNGGYSLARARANVVDHLHMYDAGCGPEAVERPNRARLELLRHVRSVREGAPLRPETLARLTRRDRSPPRVETDRDR